MKTASASQVEACCDALVVSRARLSAVMRQVTDPSATAVGTWTIGETAQHLSGSAEYWLAAIRGDTDLERLDEVAASNARALAANPERDPRVLADRLDRGEDALVAFARQVDGDPTIAPFVGAEMPLSTVLGLELGELLVHGHDIARAAGLAWPIDPHHAQLTLQGYLPLFPYLLNRERAAGVHLALDLRVRGMRPVVVRIEDAILTVEDSRGQPVDAHLSAQPATYLLLTWNRISPWKPILRGQLTVWGRRPWRVTELGPLLLT